MFFRSTQRTVRIEANVEWMIAQDPDSGEWIGVCLPLNLNAVGDTFAELHQCASDAMNLLFSDLFKEGGLEVFLRDHGWAPTVPLPERGSHPRFDASYVTRLTGARELVPADA